MAYAGRLGLDINRKVVISKVEVCGRQPSQNVCYDNCRNSRTLIGLFLLSLSGQTHEFVIYALRQQTRTDNLTVCYREKQIDVGF